MVHPQLFLYNIQSISWTTPTDRGKIEKKLIEQYDTYNDIVPAYYEITNSKSDSKRIILMTQKVSVPETYIKHTIAIGYFIDEKGQIDVVLILIQISTVSFRRRKILRPVISYMHHLRLLIIVNKLNGIILLMNLSLTK